MALTLPGKELSMTDYCAFSKDHKCIKFTDYEITRHELEEADELCHDNWREIQHLREYIDRLQHTVRCEVQIVSCNFIFIILRHLNPP